MSPKYAMLVIVALALLIPTGMGLGQYEDPLQATETPPVVIRATVEKITPTIPQDWIKVSEVSYVDYQMGKPVQITITEYQEPSPTLSIGACQSRADVELNSIAINYCDNPLNGSVNIQASMGGITQNWKTTYTRYDWSGPSGSPNPYAWYIEKSQAWWTRTGSTWTVSDSHVQIGPTTARDCSYNNVSFGQYDQDILDPGWNGNTSWTYTYYTTDEGILYTAMLIPRCQWLGETTVKESGITYGDISKVKNCFDDTGIGH